MLMKCSSARRAFLLEINYRELGHFTLQPRPNFNSVCARLAAPSMGRQSRSACYSIRDTPGSL